MNKENNKNIIEVNEEVTINENIILEKGDKFQIVTLTETETEVKTDYPSNNGVIKIKEAFKAGSNLNLLVGLLAYVTNILSYNLNQGINETYLGTAELRTNILKIVKILLRLRIGRFVSL